MDYLWIDYTYIHSQREKKRDWWGKREISLGKTNLETNNLQYEGRWTVTLNINVRIVLFIFKHILRAEKTNSLSSPQSSQPKIGGGNIYIYIYRQRERERERERERNCNQFEGLASEEYISSGSEYSFI